MKIPPENTKEATKHPNLSEFNIEQRILNHLIINGNLTSDLGLFYGRMGIVILFFHYGKYSENTHYTSIGEELLDEIWDEIHEELPISFASGLSGVGWGIEYLIQNGFADGDSFEICEDINNKLMQFDPRRITDTSLEKGIVGLLHYILLHIKGCMKQNTGIPFDSIYLSDLYQALNTLDQKDLNVEIIFLINQYTNFFLKKEIPDYTIDIKYFSEPIKINEKKLYTYPFGLKKGLSGVLLEKINLRLDL